MIESKNVRYTFYIIQEKIIIMKRFSTIIMLLIVSALIFGCSSNGTALENNTNTQSQSDKGSENDQNIGTEDNSSDIAAQDTVSENDVPENDINNTASDNQTTSKDSSVDNNDVQSSAEAEISGELTIKAEESDAVKEDGNKYILSKGGKYHVRGTCGNRMIYVDAPEQDLDIHLEGVSMTSETGALIYIENAEEVTISATDGTNNELLDNRSARTNKNEDALYGNAAIYSKDDLKFKGRGRLTVNGSYNNGIGCKNDIKIKNLTLTVKAYNNGIKGNDSVTIESGNITIETEKGNGIKTENTHISDKGNQKGYVTISGGKVNITSGDESIDAALDTIIDSANASVSTNK